MKRILVACAALTAAATITVAPPAPAGATLVHYDFSTLAQGQHLTTFDPTSDQLVFDDPTIDADDVRVTDVVGNLAVSAAGKVIYLDGMTVDEISTLNIHMASFASALVVGDGDASTANDPYGNGWNLSSFSKPNQLIGRGGPDELVGGPAGDRLVGGATKTPLEHVSRSISAGSPTASTNPSVSADGSKVAFEGGWTGFGSTNDNATDVLVRYVQGGAVTNEHKTAGGSNGLSGSGFAQISADGNYVVFASSSLLVSGSDPSNTIYRADTRNSNVVAASTATGGGTYANGGSSRPDVSADGRYVVFLSAATNLAGGTTNVADDVFLKDLQTGSTTRISTSQTGGDANAPATSPRISADGAYVVWSSAATDLTATETGGGQADVYLWKRSNGSITNVTAGGTGSASSRVPDVGSDGGYTVPTVVFESDKAFGAGDTNATTDIYAYDITTSAVSRVSTTSAGAQVALSSTEPSVSQDGRFVAFRSYSDSLATGDANGYVDVFVKDRTSGEVALVSKPATGGANQGSGGPEISSTGAWVAFESGASNLAATDANGGTNDVFVVANPVSRATLSGVGGNDTYALEQGAGDVLVEASGGGTDTVEVSGKYVLTAANVENITSPPAAVGNDDFTGNSGNNRIDPGLGNDIMRASAGNDTYVTDSSADVLTGEASASGIDTVESGVTWTLGAALENLTLTGSQPINASGNSAANVLVGNSGNNILNGSSAADTYTGGAGADGFTASSISTFDLVTDFTPGTDKVRISQSGWHVGDSDLLVEGATTKTGPGGFSNSAELVIITKNLTSLTATNAAAAIGSATGTYAVGARRMFIVDNGTTSQLMLFTSINTDAKISSSEIRPMMTFKNRANLTTSTVQFVA